MNLTYDTNRVRYFLHTVMAKFNRFSKRQHLYRIRMSILMSITLLLLYGCTDKKSTSTQSKDVKSQGVSLIVLGTAQDAGVPHIGCNKDCCADLFHHPAKKRRVVSLGLMDHSYKKNYLFEATPDITVQLKALKNHASLPATDLPDGIFLTHAHMGHYTGLMYLGKEAINASNVPVYAMPRMKTFLETNGPWSQLVENKNIKLVAIKDQEPVVFHKDLKVTPLQVPHRDEYSETVGYRIKGPEKSALFIPDIDKWEKWEIDITREIAKVDYAFLDATFYSGAEVNNRDISQIPHPFIIESMERFKNLPATEKSKIIFIHFNHTNPVLHRESEAFQTVVNNGFRVAQINEHFEL